MRIIALLTDFGIRDGYPGMMKGVIYSIAPEVKIVDITHLVHPQDVHGGSLILQRSFPYFPGGTIYIAVVDPGVGTARRPIAARLGSQFVVCPDNGLITRILEQSERHGDQVEIVHLDRPRFWLSEVSHVFHGRDIFSPVAAHLANGVPLRELGSPITDPVRLSIAEPVWSEGQYHGEIIAIDHFGNLSTNFTPQHLQRFTQPIIHVAGQEINGLVNTFGERPPGSLVALIDSDGYMALAVVQGNAAEKLGLKVGDFIEVIEGQE